MTVANIYIEVLIHKFKEMDSFSQENFTKTQRERERGERKRELEFHNFLHTFFLYIFKTESLRFITLKL